MGALHGSHPMRERISEKIRISATSAPIPSRVRRRVPKRCRRSGSQDSCSSTGTGLVKGSTGEASRRSESAALVSSSLSGGTFPLAALDFLGSEPGTADSSEKRMECEVRTSSVMECGFTTVCSGVSAADARRIFRGINHNSMTTAKTTRTPDVLKIVMCIYPFKLTFIKPRTFHLT